MDDTPTTDHAKCARAHAGSGPLSVIVLTPSLSGRVEDENAEQVEVGTAGHLPLDHLKILLTLPSTAPELCGRVSQAADVLQQLRLGRQQARRLRQVQRAPEARRLSL
jgi:hypothetical protein